MQCKADGCIALAHAQGFCRRHFENPEAPARRKNDQPIGAVKVTNQGYCWEKVGPGDWKQQHRLVMEQMLGRALQPFESVHHLNGLRADNRPQNLELWVVSQPPGQRARDLADWLRENYRADWEAAAERARHEAVFE